MPSWRVKQRPEGLGTPQGHGEPHSPQLPPVTLMTGCETYTQELPIGRWAELMAFTLTTMSKGVLILVLSMLEVADGVGDRECLGFLDAIKRLTLIWGWKF